MSVDPYHAVQQEIQSSLQAASQLQSSYLRIRNMAREDSEELLWARNELKATLASLEADLEDLEESVKIVESTDARMFGLDEAEVSKRRAYVSHVRTEIQNMRTIVSDSFVPSTTLNPANARQNARNHNLSSGSSSPRPGAAGPGSPFAERYGDDAQAAWAREEQQMMLREQETAMDSISGTLHTIHHQANLMGQELGEQTEMLRDLENNVDRVDAKLTTSYQKLKKFIRDSEEKGSSWCIGILMVILMGLLLAVILI